MNIRIDMMGKRFGAWMVLHRAENKRGDVCWWCRCDCGDERSVRGYSLRNGGSKSCGCLPHRTNALKHGEARRRMNGKETKEYRAWSAAKKRCYNKNYHSFKNYGGRGITMDDRWRNDYAKFLEDMGRCPKGLTLERIDNDKGYSPENCKWASWKEQANNRGRKSQNNPILVLA